MAAGGLSAGASALGQAAANAIDPCNASSLLNAALWGGIGGGIAKGLNYRLPVKTRRKRMIAPVDVRTK